VHLDYAYYSPVSLVLKHFGFLEKALPQTKVSWVLSQGSNRSLEYLNSGGVDFASSASLAAVLSRANGSPIKSVYVYSRAEWTALVVRKDSPYTTVADLKGKKIAATKGTDPYLFTLRSLQQAGLNKDDVELVHLQHPDGRTALEKGDVDAWAGLDPHMAASRSRPVAPAVPQHRLQQLWRGQRHRPLCQGASTHHRHRAQGVRTGAGMGGEKP
jgi:sulfonate transport system substrate-binding protein